MSCIKSIQRGTASGNQTISINEIDASKAMVTITPAAQSEVGRYSENWWTRGVCTYTLTNTTLVIENAHWGRVYGDQGFSGDTIYTWQVIEFA